MTIERIPGAVVVAFGHETITVDNAVTPKTFTAATYAPAVGAEATYALVSVETAAIRFWLDGSDPAAGEGHLQPASTTFELHGADNIRNFKAVKDAGNATLQVSYAR
jgi:hypothetical protein